MGRRSTNTTKSGKYMNPADQARKEARRRELKKNKRTRQAVRQAVLKGKNPQELLYEMEKVDIMEYTSDGQPLLHEKVLQEKRRKLRETFERVMRLYEKENPEHWVELKRMLAEYDKGRLQLEQHALAVKFAAEINPAEIPLPEMNPMPSVFGEGPPFIQPPSDIPLPIESLMKLESFIPTHSILKKKALAPEPQEKSSKPRGAPGPPPGDPPALSDSEPEEPPEEGELEEDEDFEDLHEAYALESGAMGTLRLPDSKGRDSRGSRVRFEGVEEREEKDSRTRYKKLAKQHRTENKGEDSSKSDTPSLGHEGPSSFSVPAPVVMRPPPLRPGMQVLLPHGSAPPRLVRPPPPPTGMHPRPGGPIRVPPPPPGFPPPRISVRLPPGVSLVPPGAILSAPPNISRPTGNLGDGHVQLESGPTIEAKPQLRNITAEVTRLIPTAVKLRGMAGPQPHAAKKPKPTTISNQITISAAAKLKPQHATKDDAYDEFMKEMSSLM